MERFEDELRNALKREQPPEGFSNRVLARAAATKQKSWFDLFAWRGLRWVPAGAICLVLVVAGIEYRNIRQERAEGEAAKAELMLALRITADKLQYAQLKVRQHKVQRMYLNR